MRSARNGDPMREALVRAEVAVDAARLATSQSSGGPVARRVVYRLATALQQIRDAMHLAYAGNPPPPHRPRGSGRLGAREIGGTRFTADRFAEQARGLAILFEDDDDVLFYRFGCDPEELRRRLSRLVATMVENPSVIALATGASHEERSAP